MRSKKFRIVILLASVFIFLSFIFLSFLVHKNIFTNFDFNLTVKLQNHIPRRFDGFFSALSYIGEFQIAIIMLFIILAIYRKLRGLIVLLTFCFFHVFELYGKFFVDHKPPPHFLLRTEIPNSLPQFYVSTQNSYPSGHAARAFFVTVILGYLISRSKKVASYQKLIIYTLLFFYDLLMVTSRVYLGEHWTSDVIGGTLLGLSMAILSISLL